MMRIQTIRRTPSSNNAKNVRTAAAVALLLLSLAIMAGCAGLSAGAGSNQQIQVGSLSVGSASLDFGSVDEGTSKTLTLSLSNLGGSTVTINTASFTSSYFSVAAPSLPATVAAGASTNLSLQFAPNAGGTFNDTLTLTSNASDSNVKVPLTGKGNAKGHLANNPSSGAFGGVVVGAQQVLSEMLTNTGSNTVTISQVSLTGAGFSFSGITTGASLAAGQSTSFTVTFAPQTSGAASGSVSLTSNASNSNLSIPLSGTGITAGQLASNPSSEAFGNVSVGKQQSLSATITNSGGTTVTISQASASGAGFSMSGLATPLTLSGGQSANFTVTFAPQTIGAASGSLALTSDATNPTLNIPLSGTGMASGQLSASPSSAAFGNVTVGNQLSITETVTNTGGTSVTVSQAAITGAGFTLSGIAAPVTLSGGQSTTFSIVFAPPASGAASGNLTLTSNATNPSLTIPLTGAGITPGQLTSNPSTAAFGSVNVGSQQSLTETITNTGGTSVSISQISASGTGFSLSGVSTPKTLTAGQSASFTVTFAPQAAGAASGTVTVSSSAPNPTLTIPLSGTGVAVQTAQLTVSPATLALGSIQVGSSGGGSGSLTASGGTVTVSAASTNNSAFTVGGLSLPVTIPSGQSVPFTITFSPQATGAVTATLTITNNAQPATITETLTGTGTPAPTHSVNLSWTASTSTDVAGYNIYRAAYNGSCGSFAQINSTLDTTTVYTDSSVANSTSYCYATTAVDTSNAESSYSNIVSNIAIP